MKSQSEFLAVPCNFIEAQEIWRACAIFLAVWVLGFPSHWLIIILSAFFLLEYYY